MSAVIAALYLLCLLSLPTFAVAVYARSPRAEINRLFALLSLALFAWVASLFAFNLPITAPETLLLGRLNFAAAVPAVTLGYCFILAVARKQTRFLAATWTETALLSLACLCSGWIDKAELIVHGQHTTIYGPGFPLYVVHIVGYIAAMLWTAFHSPARLPNEEKGQLSFLGLGILATASVALMTNVVLPYAFSDFRLIYIGTISTVLFLVAAAAAVATRHLFDMHVVFHTTFVFGGLIALALGAYQLALASLVHLLPISNVADRGSAATFIVLTINAFTLDPLRHWLSDLADKLLRSDANAHAKLKA